MTAKDPKPLIAFLKQGFHAVELHRTASNDGTVLRNAGLKIGDSCFMLATHPQSMPAQEFVDNPNAMQARAIKYGAKEIMPYPIKSITIVKAE